MGVSILYEHGELSEHKCPIGSPIFVANIQYNAVAEVTASAQIEKHVVPDLEPVSYTHLTLPTKA